MVDKLIKLGNWLWYNKERIVLLVAFCVLGYRVYIVVMGPEQPTPVNAVPPRAIDPELDAHLLPQAPPIRPPRPLPENYRTLVNENPFWYYGRADTGGGDEVTPEKLGIFLRKISVVGGRERARIQTKSTTKWYDEAEKFEEYELVDVDPAAQTATVFTEQYQKNLTLTLE